MKKDNELFHKICGFLLGVSFVFMLILANVIIIRHGWNHIITTILPVKKISMWQAFGLYVLASYISKTEKSNKTDGEKVVRYIWLTSLYGLLIWIASVFI